MATTWEMVFWAQATVRLVPLFPPEKQRLPSARNRDFGAALGCGDLTRGAGVGAEDYLTSRGSAPITPRPLRR